MVQAPSKSEVAPHETWFESLESDWWKDLTERAERMAKEAGYDPDTRAHDADLQHAMRTIYREETGMMSGGSGASLNWVRRLMLLGSPGRVRSVAGDRPRRAHGISGPAP